MSLSVVNGHVNAYAPWLGDVLSVAALHAASFLALRRYIAQSTLLPPPPDGTPSLEQVHPDTPRWRRYLTRKNLKRQGGLLAFLAVELLVIFGLPRWGTREVLDAFWGVFEFAFIAVVIGAGIDVLYPAPTTVRLTRNSSDKLVAKMAPPSPPPPSTRLLARLNIGASLLASGAVLYSTRAGSTILHPVVVAAWLVMVVGGLGSPRISVKGLVKVFGGFLILVPLLTALILGAVWYFGGLSKDSSNDTASSAETLATPSEWMTHLTLLFNSAMPSALPGVLIALALRFDYAALTHGPTVRTSAQPVLIPTRVDRFPAPMFAAGLVAHAVTLTVCRVVATALGMDTLVVSTIETFVTLPMSMVVLFGTAWLRGVVGEWWNYGEDWVPKAEAVAGLVADVEKAPLTDLATEVQKA